jgi:hypothetical protein
MPPQEGGNPEVGGKRNFGLYSIWDSEVNIFELIFYEPHAIKVLSVGKVSSKIPLSRFEEDIKKEQI